MDKNDCAKEAQTYYTYLKCHGKLPTNGNNYSLIVSAGVIVATPARTSRYKRLVSRYLYDSRLYWNTAVILATQNGQTMRSPLTLKAGENAVAGRRPRATAAAHPPARSLDIHVSNVVPLSSG